MLFRLGELPTSTLIALLGLRERLRTPPLPLPETLEQARSLALQVVAGSGPQVEQMREDVALAMLWILRFDPSAVRGPNAP